MGTILLFSKNQDNSGWKGPWEVSYQTSYPKEGQCYIPMQLLRSHSFSAPLFPCFTVLIGEGFFPKSPWN